MTDAKKPGWFSRRHQTQEAQEEARRHYENKSSRNRARVARKAKPKTTAQQ